MRSIMNTTKGKCFLCGKECQTQEHHIFGGSNRRVSTEWGMVVDLCPYCHNKCHNGKDSPYVRCRLHKQGQKAWEDFYGLELEFEGKNPRQEFMKVFGRNYL